MAHRAKPVDRSKSGRSAQITSSWSVYRLKIKLRGTDPPVWRRIAVLGESTLELLHRVIQIVMGWDDYHVYGFMTKDEWIMPRTSSGIDSMWVGMTVPYPTAYANSRRLKSVARQAKTKFRYIYDLGDKWEHEIRVEAISARQDTDRVPVCLDGQMACPPEDCGGPFGYGKLKQTLSDPASSEHDSMREWAGADFDPVVFDIDAVNRRLSDEFKID